MFLGFFFLKKNLSVCSSYVFSVSSFICVSVLNVKMSCD